MSADSSASPDDGNVPTGVPLANGTQPVPAVKRPVPGSPADRYRDAPDEPSIALPQPPQPGAAAQADSGSLFVFCNPWAMVRVDGREIGTTPLAEPVVLSTGSHIVSLSNNFCEPLTDTVVVTADTVVRKRYSLRLRQR